MGLLLWVDDLRNPIDFCPEGELWHWAKTVTEAIRVLATVEVSRVSLDHDIMEYKPQPDGVLAVSTGMSMETFEPVARYIALMPDPPKVAIHTANPAGRSKMEAILAEGESQRLYWR
jgi:hypothetical protein